MVLVIAYSLGWSGKATFIIWLSAGFLRSMCRHNCQEDATNYRRIVTTPTLYEMVFLLLFISVEFKATPKRIKKDAIYSRQQRHILLHPCLEPYPSVSPTRVSSISSLLSRFRSLCLNIRGGARKADCCCCLGCRIPTREDKS
jgi:hypothetical protein